MSRRNKRNKVYSESYFTPKTLRPLSKKQGQYMVAIESSPVVISTGYAGTGKTFIAATMAADLYLAKEINEITLTRPNVSSGRSIGFFPGTLEEKMDPWMAPLTHRLRDRMGSGVFETGVRNGNIRISPFETMRGSSFNGFTILDEAQNTTPHEMKMFLTRYESGTMVINGDILQSDLDEESGLFHLIQLCKSGKLSFPVIDFNHPDDIVRSSIVKEVILAYA